MRWPRQFLLSDEVFTSIVRVEGMLITVAADGAAVPVPGSLALLTAALAGLGAAHAWSRPVVR